MVSIVLCQNYRRSSDFKFSDFFSDFLSPPRQIYNPRLDQLQHVRRHTPQFWCKTKHSSTFINIILNYFPQQYIKSKKWNKLFAAFVVEQCTASCLLYCSTQFDKYLMSSSDQKYSICRGYFREKILRFLPFM